MPMIGRGVVQKLREVLGRLGLRKLLDVQQRTTAKKLAIEVRDAPRSI